MARLHLGRGRILALAALIILISGGISTQASNRVTQVWMPGIDIFNNFAFQQDLPVFGPVGPGNPAVLPRVDAVRHNFLKVRMIETEQQVFPASSGIGPTRIWAYEISDARTGQLLAPAHWPAVTVETQRYVPTIMKYVNELPTFGDPIVINGAPTMAMVQGLITTDPSIHWANPLGTTGPMNCMAPVDPFSVCGQPYLGPVPAVVHLHGGETLSDYDGGPEQWWTPNGLIGRDYRSLYAAPPGTAIYKYDNMQEPGTLWFHDHALGATRTNVYSGLAAFYFLRAPMGEPKNLPGGPYEIEIAFQDRQFDTNGQLFFPDGSGDPASNLNGEPPNPTVNPFWIPEYVGDVWTVNGAIWPKLAVEPRRYRFRLLGGSNARMVNLTFGSAPVYIIGRDGGCLDVPAQVPSVFIAPGQRIDVIVDFTGMGGQSFVVTNDAPVPFPSGLVPGDVTQEAMGQVMRIDVTRPLRGTDTSANPATGGAKRPSHNQTVKLTDFAGNLAPGVKIANVRQLILKEFDPGTGPEMILVNNTRWNGLMSGNVQPYFPVDGVSELPQVGATEIWQIINLTMDAHPMHTHLFQFQILSRQPYDQLYLNDWGAAFPGPWTNPDPLNPMPGWGPPLPYDNGETTVINGKTVKVLGGNPRIEPYLTATTPRFPNPEERGWHDTAVALPFEVMTIVVRVTPTWVPVWLGQSGRNLYTFDPTSGPGYVWHCHIVDHEDNEMMRPMKIKKILQ